MQSRLSATRLRIGASTLLLAALVGCASTDYGSAARDPARMPGLAEVAERTRYGAYHYLRPLSSYQEAVAARVGELSETPMTEAAAVEIAVLQDAEVQSLLLQWPNYALRASFVEAVAETATDSKDSQALESKILGEILSRSATRRWDRSFGEEYLKAANTIVDAAARARTAYYEAVAAAQLAAMFEQVLQADQAAVTLVNEQYRSGTTSRLDQVRQHLAYAEAMKAGAEARREAVTRRETLNRILNLHGTDTAWTLPDRLPDLPPARPVLGDVEAYAVTHSPTAYAGRASTVQLKAGITMRSEVREAYSRMLIAYDIAKYQRDVVMPLMQVALEETQLSYNAMLGDVYELIDTTREQIQAGKEYVTTLAEFWAARADLAHKLGGRWPEHVPAASQVAIATSFNNATGSPH
jgi:outer membrane protein TolC